MTGSERQELKAAVSRAKREKLRRSGGFESDEQRQEVQRLMQRRADERADRRVRLELEALQARVEALEDERSRLRRELRQAQSWIDLAYGHSEVKPPRVPRYGTEEARQEARRASWRESKRRAKLRQA